MKNLVKKSLVVLTTLTSFSALSNQSYNFDYDRVSLNNEIVLADSANIYLEPAVSVNDVILFNDQFTDILDKAILEQGNPYGSTIVHKKIYKEFINQTIYKSDKYDMRPLTDIELSAIKSNLKEKSQAYILLKDSGFRLQDAYANGTFVDESFVGSINKNISLK